MHWGDDPVYAIPWVKRMPYHFYRVHSAYCHYAHLPSDDDADDIEEEEGQADAPAAAEPTDPVWRTRAIRVLAMKTIQRLYNPGGDLAGDELNEDTESNKVEHKQRLRFKPGCNEGLLLDGVADSITSYLLSWEESRSDPSGETDMSSVFSRLLEFIPEDDPKWRHLYVDSRTTSVELFEKLYTERSILATGTLDTSRVDIPRNEIAAVAAQLEWGEWSCLSKNNCEIVIWADRSVVAFLTSGFSFKPGFIGTLMRKPPKEKKKGRWTNMQCHYVAQAYNMMYRGIDDWSAHEHRAPSARHVRTVRFPSKQAKFLKDRLLTCCWLVIRLMPQFMTGKQVKKPMAKTAFIGQMIRSWCDHMDFRKKQSLQIMCSPQVVAAVALPPDSASSVVIESPESGESAATASKSRSGKRKQSGSGSAANSKQKKAKQPRPVINIPTLPLAGSVTISATEQRKHMLVRHGRTASRRCCVCRKYPTALNKGRPSENLMCKWECRGCKGKAGKKGRAKDGVTQQNFMFMHEECYLWHPPHRGFSQVWMGAPAEEEV